MLLCINHIGVAVRNINKELGFYSALGYKPKGEAFDNQAAGIRVQFLSAEGQPDMELVQNLEKDGPVTAHIQAKRKFYHIAYTTDDIQADMQRFVEEQNAVVLVPITHEECFEIEYWCYLAFRNMAIIELVQLKG